MPVIHARPTQTVEAIHASDSDFEEVVRDWLSHREEEEQSSFLKSVSEQPHKPWVVRTSDGFVGMLHPANFAADWEDIAATDVLDEIWAERQRHPSLGYTVQHDDAHGTGHLIEEVRNHLNATLPAHHPTDAQKRRELIQAGSLIVAAIDKIDRVQTVRTFSVD